MMSDMMIEYQKLMVEQERELRGIQAKWKWPGQLPDSCKALSMAENMSEEEKEAMKAKDPSHLGIEGGAHHYETCTCDV